ncbi:MAG: hypothetical protein XD89_0777, partial [Anaerolineae bacterium 49_20]
MKWRCLLIMTIFLSACQPQVVTSTALPPANTVEPTAAPLPTQTMSRTSQQPTQTMEMPTSTTHAFRVCCPLEEETLETLPSILVNPLV